MGMAKHSKSCKRDWIVAAPSLTGMETTKECETWKNEPENKCLLCDRNS